MNNIEKRQVIEQFIVWLSEKDLHICNFTNASCIFWPIGEPIKLAESFVNK